MTWWHTVDYPEPRAWINRGFFTHEIPRPILLCRLAGHRPVVDGVDFGHSGEHPRWVVCGRCGTRPHPQGSLNPTHYPLGIPYQGLYDNRISPTQERTRAPGPWPTNPTWDLSTQLLIGGAYPGASVHFKVGNAGSENALAAHLHLGQAFALYISTGELGRGIQRLLNPTGYESKVTELRTMEGLLYWKLWADQNTSTHTTPRWKNGSTPINPLDIIWGPKRNRIKDLGEPVTTTLALPGDETHEVTFQLQRYTLHRPHRRRPISITYRARWETEPGIELTPTGRRAQSSTITIPTTHTGPDQFLTTATTALTEWIEQERNRHDYTHQTPPAI